MSACANACTCLCVSAVRGGRGGGTNGLTGWTISTLNKTKLAFLSFFFKPVILTQSYHSDGHVSTWLHLDNAIFSPMSFERICCSFTFSHTHNTHTHRWQFTTTTRSDAGGWKLRSLWSADEPRSRRLPARCQCVSV